MSVLAFLASVYLVYALFAALTCVLVYVAFNYGYSVGVDDGNAAGYLDGHDDGWGDHAYLSGFMGGEPDAH